jgi:hypothetical protein
MLLSGTQFIRVTESKGPFGTVARKKRQLSTPALKASFYNYLEYLARIKGLLLILAFKI